VTKLVFIALAGAAGTLCRHGTTILVHRMWGGPSPLGTLAVNMIGCFLFGVAWAAVTARSTLSADAKVVVLVGFMGAFTTFSSFASDSAQLIGDAQWLRALANILAHNVLGVLLLLAGIAAGKAV
jgi:CrcB protein